MGARHPIRPVPHRRPRRRQSRFLRKTPAPLHRPLNITPTRHQRLDALAVGTLLLLCTLWGVQQVASKIALAEGIPPLMQAVLRSAIAAPLLMLFLFAREGRRGLQRFFAQDGSLWPGLITGFFFAVEFGMLFPGVKLTSASHAVILLFTGGFFTAVLAHLFLPEERLRLGQWSGLTLALIGVITTMSGVSGGQSSLPGDLLVLGAAALWGATTVLVKANPALNRISPEKVLAYQLMGALPFLVLFAYAAAELSIPTASTRAWASVLYQGAIVAFASYLTWFWLLARYPASRVAAFSILTPLLGVVAAWLILGDPLTPSLLLGLGLVCAGLMLVNPPAAKPRKS